MKEWPEAISLWKLEEIADIKEGRGLGGLKFHGRARITIPPEDCTCAVEKRSPKPEWWEKNLYMNCSQCGGKY